MEKGCTRIYIELSSFDFLTYGMHPDSVFKSTATNVAVQNEP